MSKKDASELFQAVGEKSRFKIIKLCFEGEQTFDHLMSGLKMEKTLLSKHLKVLKDSSILIASREGRQTSYKLNPRVCHKTLEKTLAFHCCNIEIK